VLRFSIITIEKNYPDGLLRTLQSVASQNLPNGMLFSQLICEGTPGSAHKMIQDLGLTNKSRVCSSTDTGLYNGMNQGLNSVTHGWVLFLNAGDTLIDRDALYRINKVIQNTNAPVVQFKCNYSDGTERPFKRYSRFSLFLGRNMHIHPALCLNLDSIGHARFDESFRIAADYKMANELIKSFTFEFSDEVISNFEGGGISSKSVEILIKEMNLVRTLVSPRFFPSALLKAWNLYFSCRLKKRMGVK
jgi:glycosyltransferase involved in cell wall biosynthesis